MNTQNIIKKIKQTYPGKEIILDPPEHPTEIICEIEPTSEHPNKSVALAIVGSSAKHYHSKSTEIYEALIGDLIIYKDGVKHILKPGETITIEPGVVHYAKGDEAWFLTHSTPGWTPEDHIIVT